MNIQPVGLISCLHADRGKKQLDGSSCCRFVTFHWLCWQLQRPRISPVLNQQVETIVFLSCWNKNLQTSGSHICEASHSSPGRWWSLERHRDTCANCLTSTLGVRGRGHPPNVSSTSFNRALCHNGEVFYFIHTSIRELLSSQPGFNIWYKGQQVNLSEVSVKKHQTCLMVTSASDQTHTSTDHYAALEWPFNSFLTLSPSLFSARCSPLMRSDIFCLTLLQNPFPLFPPSAQAGLWEMKWRRVERLLGKGDRGLWSIIDTVTGDDGSF